MGVRGPGGPKRYATHYTVELDDTGRPYAVNPKHYPPDEIAGELPEGWSTDFWDWQPRGDLNGQWVELEDRMRETVWDETKAAREEDRKANIKVKIGSRELTFQTGGDTLLDLMAQLEAARLDADWPGVTWTTAGNAQVQLDRDGLVALFLAVAAHRRDVHAQSQKGRARIFDTSKPLVRSVDDVLAAVPRNSGR